ncbi:MAG: hypothetical protein ACK4RK_06960 [Gemmataceae bacterium]
MLCRCLPALSAGVVGLILFLGTPAKAQAQYYSWDMYRFPLPQCYTMNNFWYYPYYYFPANYWPCLGPKWPEGPGEPYRRYPAYMAFPPFTEPGWRYEYFEPQTYHRGYHFMLDIF